MTHFPPDEKKRLIVRLNRISGQINGLSKMINDDRDSIIDELVEHIEKLR